MALETDEELFFAHISKQISLLLMDDDDGEDSTAHYQPAVSLQAFPQPIPPFPIALDQSCRRESKGTGVFIPLSPWPRRKNKQRRRSYLTKNSNSQVQNRSTMASPTVADQTKQPDVYCNCEVSRKHA